MRTLVTVIAALAVLLIGSQVMAQMQHPTTAPASGQTPGGMPPGDPSQHQMMGQGMMGGMMMCPMMGGMQGQGMMGPMHRQRMMGMGMGPGMMGTGGMMNPSDPKAMARMLKLRGDIMKAIGEVLVKHAQALEQEK